MENSHHRRQQHAAPHLLRSKSQSVAATSSPEPSNFTSKPSKTSKIENIPKITAKKTQKPINGGDGGGFVMFMPRSKSRVEVPRRTRSASTSPSAWALSPGRPCSSPAAAAVDAPPVPRSPASFERLMKQEGKGGVGGVLKYFRQKKANPLLEEEYHRFRVAYNRLLQWRFVNARAEASMAAVKKRVAQKKLFNGWVRITLIRNLIAEKQTQIQKLKHQIKLYQIFGSQMSLINEWSKIEPKNVEAVGRVVRKLSAISVCLPLVQNAEGDVMSVYEALSTAVGVMDDIKAMILEMHWQVEQACFLLTELSIMLKQQKQYFEELEKGVTMVASLEVQEKSLRLHCIQLVTEVKEIGT